MSIRVLDGLTAVADQYDLFIIDQWGVLHDGVNPHEGAVEVLRALRKAGKTITILSNSSRRCSITVKHMSEMGFTSDLFDHCVTSGEEVWCALHDKKEPFYEALGERCFMFAWQVDKTMINTLPLVEAEDIEDADFILNSGTPFVATGGESLQSILQRAAARGLPMICSNPDFVSKGPDGELSICPGTTARQYAALGGRVDYRGKPYAPVYQRCFALSPDHKSALAIGDSLYHDIGGANNVGIDSLFISSGLHAGDLSDLTDPSAVAALCDREGQTPTYVMPTLRW